MSDGFLTLDGNGDYLSTADKAALDVTGPGSLRVILCVACDDWFSVVQYVQVKAAASTQRAWRCAVTEEGRVQLAWSEDGTVWLTRTSTEDMVVVNGHYKWIDMVLDPDVGGTDATIAFGTSDDPTDTDPLSVGFTQLGLVQNFGTTTSINAGTGLLYFGGNPLAAAPNYFAGKMYGQWVYNDGVEIVNADFRDDTQGWSTPPGTDDHANDWAFSGNAFWTPPAVDRIVGRSVHYDFENNRVLIESGV